ncbi:unnamed protein product [Fusarium venenatum]|uniref:Uncharacterized protein n=1 Tax=Fusarium venenatum TaxID=56646 RepID=A0A2L2SYG2_9HYPO|nr:uncharacterized protein FVRRES_13916 [Fusarium venenatum]CEI42160.1 unnamed protein product [Fusarium venenatum]
MERRIKIITLMVWLLLKLSAYAYAGPIPACHLGADLSFRSDPPLRSSVMHIRADPPHSLPDKKKTRQ